MSKSDIDVGKMSASDILTPESDFPSKTATITPYFQAYNLKLKIFYFWHENFLSYRRNEYFKKNKNLIRNNFEKPLRNDPTYMSLAYY
jgi:hypothetical protein